MNQDQIDDLKQFIATTIAQQTSDMATKDDIANMATKDDIANMATKDDIANMATKDDISELKVDIARVDKKLDDLSEHVSEILDTLNDETDAQLKNLDLRVTKLEQMPTMG